MDAKEYVHNLSNFEEIKKLIDIFKLQDYGVY